MISDNERDLIGRALAEDIGAGDITSLATIDENRRGEGVLRARTSLVVAGLAYVRAAFEIADVRLVVFTHKTDGDRAHAGEAIATVTGPIRSLLAAERTALNLAQRLCGVAALTATFVEAVQGTRCRIIDTRKTTPLWRAAEKSAVLAGGGVNHRMGLFDVALVKDNHIDACGGVGDAVARVRAALGPDAPIIAEIRRADEIESAIAAGATRLLFDNMDPPSLGNAVRIVAGRVPTEASGGITLANVRAIAATGVDFASIGALTHSAPAADLNFKIRAIA
ncbi:carboxylating nicotinate-nucleotide diphosphorylase [bacterium]|nr:carboxylating nicotinate-nucleotide diphosphorylase [bacterium]